MEVARRRREVVVSLQNLRWGALIDLVGGVCLVMEAVTASDKESSDRRVSGVGLPPAMSYSIPLFRLNCRRHLLCVVLIRNAQTSVRRQFRSSIPRGDIHVCSE